MFHQTGPELVFDDNGLLQRELIIRLLVLPNDIAGIRESIEWIGHTQPARCNFTNGTVLPHEPGGFQPASHPLCHAASANRNGCEP